MKVHNRLRNPFYNRPVYFNDSPFLPHEMTLPVPTISYSVLLQFEFMFFQFQNLPEKKSEFAAQSR